MDKKTLLICGGTGLLGPYIREAFEGDWKIIIASRHSTDHACDFTDAAAVCSLIEQVKPDVVFHLIALTNVDECEENPDHAHSLNALTVRNVVQTLNPATHLVYISTDQVYPDTPGPHQEDHEAPVNVYGATKLDGEKEALSHRDSLVLRVNLFGPARTENRMSLSDFFIKSFEKQTPVTMFDDVFFSPLHMGTLAQIARKCVDHRLCGVYNLGSRAGLSKADFALKLAQHLNLDASTAQIGQSSAVTGRAHRTKDLRMDVSRIEKALGIKLPTLQEEIEKL
ncbi:MAG: SDR family oxidoreductase [Alphaproteobacteria bacterium]|nr:SDR family oxidoreductase [Alphaproteobacteria bacterium]